jgi:V/A-type H+-transporting ATPase subunit E
MSLSDITKKIENDASQKAKRILNDAKDSGKAIMREVEEKKSELSKRYEKSTADLLSRNEARVKDGAHREGKQHIEEEKRKHINKVFTKAYENLVNLPSDEYTEYVSSLIGSLSIGKSEVSAFGPKNRETETKEALKKAGIEAKVSVDEKIEGGVRIEGEDFEYDFSFKKLMEQKRDELEVKVAKTLFA